MKAEADWALYQGALKRELQRDEAEGAKKPEPWLGPFALRFKEAVEACRVDNWRRGYEILTELAPQVPPKQVMPGIFYSYLGVALARVGGQRHEGMELVRYGLRIQPREPDNVCNMALLCHVLGRRSEAVRWAREGLKRAPYHRRLNELRKELGIRRTPPVPWLDRTNPVNVLLGQVTWRWYRWRQERYEEKRELMEIERV